jgi:hypothetical protein
MKMTFVCELEDIVQYATTKGYYWNQSCDLFNGTMVEYNRTLDSSNWNPDVYGDPPEMCDLLKGFMKENGVTEIYIEGK